MKILTALFLLITPCILAEEYTFTKIERLGDNYGMSRPVSINDYGQVVGWSDTQSGSRAFIWDSVNGTQDIGDLGGGWSRSIAINNAGQVIGASADSSGNERLFLWDNTNGMRSIGGIVTKNIISASINNSGQVVGTYNGSTGWPEAFRWDSSSGIQQLGNLCQNPYNAQDSQSAALRINNNGQVVGWAHNDQSNQHAFLWDDQNGMQDLGVLDSLSGNKSSAMGINDLGQIVGSSNTHAFLWDETNGMVDLGTLGGSRSFAVNINDNGQIVGQSYNGQEQDRAVLWEDGSIFELNSFLTPDTDFWYLAEVIDINNSGQIIGIGIEKFASRDSMYVMTPVPEPTSLLLLGLGGIMLRRKIG